MSGLVRSRASSTLRQQGDPVPSAGPLPLPFKASDIRLRSTVVTRKFASRARSICYRSWIFQIPCRRKCGASRDFGDARGCSAGGRATNDKCAPRMIRSRAGGPARRKTQACPAARFPVCDLPQTDAHYGILAVSSKGKSICTVLPSSIAIGPGAGGSLVYIPSEEPEGGGPDCPS